MRIENIMIYHLIRVDIQEKSPRQCREYIQCSNENVIDTTEDGKIPTETSLVYKQNCMAATLVPFAAWASVCWQH